MTTAAKYQRKRKGSALIQREFPNYSKLDFNGPMRSYTCSKRCVSCQATYPDHPIFDISPCCDVTTTVIRKPPDLTWDEAKRIVLNSRFEKYYRRSNSGINEDQQDYLSDPLEVNPEEFRNALKEVLREIEDLTSQDCL